MELVDFIQFFNTKKRKSDPNGAVLFHHSWPQDRAIHINAEGGWTLTGEGQIDGKDRPPRSFVIPLPAGQYSFDFPPASANLTVIVIDPDPGSGEGKFQAI